MISLVLLTLSIVVAIFPYLQQQADTVCGCAQFSTLTSSPTGWMLITSILILSLLGIVMTWRVGWMLRATRQFKEVLSQYITQRTRYQGVAIYTITHNEPLAVCVGYFKPKVFISQSLIEQLSGFELFAVIQHEVAHAKRYDPLQRLVLSALPNRIPYWRNSIEHYFSAQEIVADDAVTDAASIRSAFVKLTELAQPQQSRLAATWFSTSQARINHWLGEQTPLPSFRWAALGAIVIAVVLLTSYRAFAAEPAAQAFGQCLSVQTMCKAVMSYVVQ
ncbi:MAG: M56 family metallopeptidase [Candidatus Kerfeldbacteria bacterium]|nr:M56 family metallopeptidase [Candidatus Kerfeldbacteria bacterium]